MMLSPSAARIGTTSTMLRELAKKKSRRAGFPAMASRHLNNNQKNYCSLYCESRIPSSLSGTRKGALLPNARAAFSASSEVFPARWKSTLAAYSDSDSDEDNDAEVNASTTRNTVGSGALSHEEAWMINLGRADNNEWLTGSRDPDEWFTGKQPKICPGVDSNEIIRSLPLPRLDAVTREAALEYFDKYVLSYDIIDAIVLYFPINKFL